MKTIFIFLIEGFEEVEALATVDIMRRAGLNIKTVSLEAKRQVKGSHDILVEADLLFGMTDFSEAELLILPGGTTKFNNHEGVKNLFLDFWKKGNTVAAICASPMVLGGLGILEGKKATCYPGFEKYLQGATLCTNEAVVVDGNVVTGRGPGLTFEFALKLVELLAGAAKAEEVAKGLLLR